MWSSLQLTFERAGHDHTKYHKDKNPLHSNFWTARKTSQYDLQFVQPCHVVLTFQWKTEWQPASLIAADWFIIILQHVLSMLMFIKYQVGHDDSHNPNLHLIVCSRQHVLYFCVLFVLETCTYDGKSVSFKSW